MEPPITSQTHVRAIDGMRGVSILLVIASHYGLGGVVPGGFGVTLFFFISGFLITSLLLNEHSQAGSIAVGAFFARRALRLIPALLTFVALISVALYFVSNAPDRSQILAAIFYLMNYYVLLYGDVPMPLYPLWSLAVEEHYYLFFPAIVLLTARKPVMFLTLLIALCILVLTWRCVLVYPLSAGELRTHIASDTRIDSILYGAILATLQFTARDRLGNWFANPGVALIAGAALLVSFAWRDPAFRETFRYTLQGLALIPLFYFVIAKGKSNLARTILERPSLVWTGKLSYSLYLWNAAVAFFVFNLLDLAPLIQIPLAIAISFVAAAASYYLVETPFLKLKRHFRAGECTPRALSCQNAPEREHLES